MAEKGNLPRISPDNMKGEEFEEEEGTGPQAPGKQKSRQTASTPGKGNSKMRSDQLWGKGDKEGKEGEAALIRSKIIIPSYHPFAKGCKSEKKTRNLANVLVSIKFGGAQTGMIGGGSHLNKIEGDLRCTGKVPVTPGVNKKRR